MADAIPLRLGKLSEGVPITRSGFRWLAGEGQSFRSGDLIGYCDILLGGPARGQGDFYSFEQERCDFQVALIARVSGRLRPVVKLHDGGWNDRQSVFPWDPQAVIATIDPLSTPSPAEAAFPVDYLCLAGRRYCDLAEDRSGLMTGWHDRSRAWRHGRCDQASDTSDTWGSVLGLGICELHTVIRGEKGDFMELLGAVRGPAHVVEVPDRPLVHSARIIIEQIRRTPAQEAAITQVFAQAVAADPAATSPSDWAFAAMSRQALQRSPTTERYDLLTPAGVPTVGPADAVILSINAEAPMRLRHRRHGFHFDCHTYRLQHLSAAMRRWFQQHFEWVAYPIEAVRRDYRELAALLRRDHPERQILVLNAMSTLVGDDIQSYESFDAPLGLTLKGARARELNTMLHEIAGETGIAIVDSDAIGAELGGAICIHDGVHANGAMQAALREEILSILRARGVPGFAAAIASENLEVHRQI